MKRISVLHRLLIGWLFTACLQGPAFAAEGKDPFATPDFQTAGEPSWSNDNRSAGSYNPFQYRPESGAVVNPPDAEEFLPPVNDGEHPVLQSRHVQSPEIGPFTPVTPPEENSGYPRGEVSPNYDPARGTHGPPFGSGPFHETPEEPPFVVPYQTRLMGTVVAGERNELGMTDFDLSVMLAFPRSKGFAITPGFQTFFLNGPDRTDLPGQIYDARLEFALKRPWNDQFSYLLTFAPGIYSDFNNTGSDAFRIMSRALGFYKVSPATEFTLGLVYIDRENMSLLPAIGVIHTPEPDVRLELVFPKPKVAARVSQGSTEEWWAYVTGEFGGGSFAIQRVGGADDILTYSDWRLLVGLEGKFPGSKTLFENIPSVFLETGFVFNRKVEYKSERGDYDPGNTGLVRAGFVY